jgi:hypothetical protein
VTDSAARRSIAARASGPAPTDHTREYARLLAVFPGHHGRRHDGALADVGASAMRWLTGRDVADPPGTVSSKGGSLRSVHILDGTY